jgi:hypothetical protein
MVAKRFFYVCAGILCLALAYHLGARRAGAQGPVSVTTAYGWRGSSNSPGNYAAVVERTVYLLDNGGHYQIGPPVPGTAPIVAVGGDQGNTVNNVTVVLGNGDAYACGLSEATWHFEGNIIGVTVPAAQQTWGGVKARYRPGAVAQEK